MTEIPKMTQVKNKSGKNEQKWKQKNETNKTEKKDKRNLKRCRFKYHFC